MSSKRQLTTGYIRFNNVCKTYSISKGKYGLLREIISNKLSRSLRSTKEKQNLVQALNGVSFTIKKGECLGIIGRNGAGKSTILKLISKITYPEKGTIEVKGRISAFIELGAGLHHELTGRENIYLYGAILGMKKREIQERFPEIVRFAGIKRFLDVPIKKYSSGMYSRLGFSVCAFSNPDILLVDEVLAVGDVNFQKQCLARMHSFIGKQTIIFVSHNMQAIKNICTRVVYIDKGRIVKQGNPKSVVDYFLRRSRIDKN